MPQPYLMQLSQEMNLPMATVEGKWNQAKAAVHSQYPNLTEKDDKYWALVTSITKKMLHVKESLMKPRTRLQEADLSGGTADDVEDIVVFDDYPTWVAAVTSCGANVESGSVFVDCSILDQLLMPSADASGDTDDDTDSDDASNSPSAGASTDSAAPAGAPAANESFENLLDSEMIFVNAVIREATVPNTQDSNIDAQIAAADEKIENLRQQKLQLIAQKRTADAKTVSAQINAVRQHLSTIRQQKQQLAAQRKAQKQTQGKK